MDRGLRSHHLILLAALTGFGIACSHPGASGRTVPQGGPPARDATVDANGKTLAQLFEGRAGVTVTAVSGGVKLRIRNAENRDGQSLDPLFVIDGNPIAPPDGVLSMNPNDILKIEILKDDASTLIWGQRAANGVVKITTKRK